MRRRTLLPFLCALAIAGPFAFAPVSDPDSPWHLALGRALLGHGLFHTNALSWKYGATPWFPVSWLYDAACALLPQPWGIQLVTFLLLAATLAALAAACAREGSAWILPAAALLLVPRLVPRPHVATWAALACALWLGPLSMRARLACVALIAFFANLHPGAAFAGFILAAHAGEAFLKTRRRPELAVAVLALLAIAANPGAPAYLVANLGVDDVIRIREMEPPHWPEHGAFFLLAPLALGFALLRARERPALAASAAALALLGLRANRETYDAELVFAVILAAALCKLPVRPRALAAVGLALLPIATHRLDRDFLSLRPGLRWDDRALPIRAAAFIRDAGLAGPHFNGLRDGGYLAWAGVPPLVDGRIQAVPREAWTALQQAETSRAAFAAYLQALGAEWALTSRIKERIGGYKLLENVPEWALVYWDDTSEVFVRRDKLGGLPEYALFHPWGEIVGSVEKLPRAQLPALIGELDRFDRTSPGDPFSLLIRCAALQRLGTDGHPLCALALQAGAPPSLVDRASKLTP